MAQQTRVNRVNGHGVAWQCSVNVPLAAFMKNRHEKHGEIGGNRNSNQHQHEEMIIEKNIMKIKRHIIEIVTAAKREKPQRSYLIEMAYDIGSNNGVVAAARTISPLAQCHRRNVIIAIFIINVIGVSSSLSTRNNAP